MKRNEDGMVTGFAVIFAVALLLFAGLVLDGGMVLTTKRQAIDQAQAAARVGAQAVNTDIYRSSGLVVLDDEQARSAAMGYLPAADQQGTVDVSDDEVRVTITKNQRIQILGIGGLRQVRVTGIGVARAERG